MSRSNRFQWGRPYLLTDTKERVFDGEPAIYVGRHDSDKERPTICAVCGEPLGSKGYGSFFLMGPNGRGKDMMVGNGCLRDRIDEEEIPVEGTTFKETWERTTIKFPNCGRWYGTFLHHCIAKPYVRDRMVAEGWDESILRLPGVKYIMRIVDELREEGWSLDAEKVLECGRVDLLATHPEKGTVVFDWKSDKAFDSHETYMEQVGRYMAELSEKGMENVTGYIVWITKEKKERVPYRSTSSSANEGRTHKASRSEPIRCSLSIDMDGGEGIKWKSRKEHSHRRPYGDEVSFYIPRCMPSRHGYEFAYYEASPYREGDLPQWFTMEDAEAGFYVNFICSDKRRSFSIKACWKRTRPFECFLEAIQKTGWGQSSFYVNCMSKIDEAGNDYVDFDVSEINRRLGNAVLVHAKLVDTDMPAVTKDEWMSEDLQEGMAIRIPCTDGRSEFKIYIETKTKKKESAAKPKQDVRSASVKDETKGPLPLPDAIKPFVHLDEAQMNQIM